MNWDAAKVILDIVQLVALFFVTFFVWTQGRAKANKEEIDDFKRDATKRFDNHGERLTRVEGRLDALPTRSDVGKLHGRIDDLVGSMGKVATDVSAIGATVTAMNTQVQLLTENEMRERDR